jgi:hypothetical protein
LCRPGTPGNGRPRDVDFSFGLRSFAVADFVIFDRTNDAKSRFFANCTVVATSDPCSTLDQFSV